jgi:alpha-tubulin suppressor-like RCC1 family protein
MAESYSYLAIQSGRSFACGLVTDHSVRCWGSGQYGEVGNFNGTNTSSTVITDANSNIINDFLDIAAGGYHTCGIRSDASVWCWGWSNAGALGSSSGNTMVAVPATAFTTNDALSLTAGNSLTCVLRKNGEVWCWGSNNYGQLGQPYNVISSSSTAYQIQSWTDVRGMISNSDAYHVCAIRQETYLNNTLWCWGRNDIYQLGVGNILSPSVTPSATPTISPTPSGTATSTASTAVSPSITPSPGESPSSTPTVSFSATPSTSVIPPNYEYVPQNVSVPIM